MSRQSKLDILRGNCTEDDLPAQHSRTVRVYLSATKDMNVERESILRDVYPKIKQHCCGRYGIDFQFVDLHWGVIESIGHLAGDLAVIKREIQRCRQRSLGPSFLCLVGGLNGPPALPDQISPHHYQILLDELTRRDDKMAALMTTLYDLDENNKPPLISRRRVPWIKSDQWEGYHEFYQHFTDAVMAMQEAGKFTHDDVTSLMKSAFETEIFAGIEDTEEETRSKTLCFTRIIETTGAHQYHQQFGFSGDTKVEVNVKDAQSRLLTIRDHDLHKWLPAANIKVIKTDYQVTGATLDSQQEQLPEASFSEKSQIVTQPRQEEYVDDLCKKVLSQLKRLVDRAAAPLGIAQNGVTEDACAEVVEHWRKAFSLRDALVDSTAMDSLHKYLNGPIRTLSVLHGRSPQTRATILARLATSMAAPRDKSSRDPVVVIRFLSLSDVSMTTTDLLSSLARQISLVYGFAWKEGGNKQSTAKRFLKCIEFAKGGSPLFIMIDELEKLSPDSYDLSWIPDTLPENVKVIFGCSSKTQIFEDLCAKTPYMDCIIEIETETLEKTIPGTLEVLRTRPDSDRALTNSQYAHLHALIHQGDRTLPEHILYDIAQGWRSYDTICMSIDDSEEGQILAWFEHLENIHGCLLVSSCLQYITAGKHGVTECELLDLLSIDEELLNSGVLLKVTPGLRRLPDLLWARLRADLDPSLLTRTVDDRDVVCWAHQVFPKCVLARYVDEINPISKIHARMAQYFKMITPTCIPLDDSKSKLSHDMRLDPQPYTYDNRNSAYSQVMYNKRKISELPHQFLNARQYEELKKHILFSYKWLNHKLLATSVGALLSTLEDLQEDVELKTDQELTEVLRAIQDSASPLAVHPGSLRAELTGRLMTSLGDMPHVTSLIRQCDDDGYKDCVLTPLTSSFDAGEEEIVQVVQCDVGPAGELLVASAWQTGELVVYTVPEKVSLWDENSGKKKRNFECSQYTYCTDLRVSQDGRKLLAFNNGQPKYTFLEDSPLLDIFDMETGRKLHRIYFGESGQQPKRLFRVTELHERHLVFDTPNYVAVCIDTVRLCDIKTGKELSMAPWPFLLTPDERYIVMAERDGHRLVVRTFPELKRKSRLSSPKNITAIVALVTATSMKLLVAAGSAGIISMYDFANVEGGAEMVDPEKKGVLIEKKGDGLKGGCGKLILSPDNTLVFAIYIYSIGKALHRTNFVMSAQYLEHLHIYRSDLSDIVQFSPDSKYILHLKVAVGEFDVIDSKSGMKKATYGQEQRIQQMSFGKDPNKLFVTSREGLVALDIELLIKRGRLPDVPPECDTDTESVSVELNTPPRKLRTILADVEWTDVMRLNDVESVPLNLTQLDEQTGLVSASRVSLTRGVHFPNSDLLPYLCDVILTADGSRLLLVFDQLHVMTAQSGSKDWKTVAGPLNDHFTHTKVMGASIGTAPGRRGSVFGVSATAIDQGGTSLRKGETIYGNSVVRRGTMFTAEGGETVQRIPSTIRVFSATNGDCVQKISIRNERIVTCTEHFIVTATLGGDFTNVYSISSATCICTLQCRPVNATFSPGEAFLILIPEKNPSEIHIYSGPTYLDMRRCRLAHGDLVAWEMITCSQSPGTVLVSTSGEGRYRLGRDPGVTYIWVDLPDATVTNEFTCNSELVHVLPDGTRGVDTDFDFYDLTTGNVLFRVQVNDDLTLMEHASFVTNDGKMVVFLDNNVGTINVVDIEKKKVICQCFYHASRPNVDGVRGHREVASLLPINGGYQMAIVEGPTVKQFAIQTASTKLTATGFSKLYKTAYRDAKSRAEYFHVVNTNETTPIIRLARRKKRMFRTKLIHPLCGRKKKYSLSTRV